MRPDSPTYGNYHAEILTEDNRRMLYVPQGCAHGYLTLEDNAELIYFASAAYDQASERGVRYNDPQFGIKWPELPEQISDKDARWRDFSEEWHGVSGFRGLV